MIGKILLILAAIAKAVRRWFRRREREHYERETHEIEQNPAGWMDKHFNGVAAGDDAGQLQRAPPVSDDAGSPSETGPAKHDNKRARRDQSGPS